MRDQPSQRVPLKSNPAGQGIILICLSLLAIGTVMVFSSAIGDRHDGGTIWSQREYKHLSIAIGAAVVMLSGSVWDYRKLFNGDGFGAKMLMILAVMLSILVLVPGVGLKFNGAQRWLPLTPGKGGLTFQPSEFLKIAMVVFIAYCVREDGSPLVDFRRFKKGFFPVAVLIFFCAAIVAAEDLGSGVIIAATGFALVFLAGGLLRYLLGVFVIAIGGFLGLLLSSPVRIMRIKVFLNPWDTENPYTWQLRQSLIAVGSGGLFGKGLGAGAAKLGFLPESQTDFIFALICEELGLLGAVTLIILFGMLVVLLWRVAARCEDARGAMIARGVGLLITIQVILHLAVNLGAAPPTGVSLPLIGAGGTALLLTSILVSLAVSVTTYGCAADENALTEAAGASL